MPKESFFDEEDNRGGETPPTVPEKKDPPEKEEKPREEKPVEPAAKAPEDNIDWKAKYEEAQAAQENDRYYDELLRFDDTLEGDTIDELEGGKRYRELRKMGLSPHEAYGAMSASTYAPSSGSAPTPRKNASAKAHVTGTQVRSAWPGVRMDRETRGITDELFPDMPAEEKEALFKRVT